MSPRDRRSCTTGGVHGETIKLAETGVQLQTEARVQGRRGIRKTDRAARFIARAEQSPWVRRYDHRKVTSEAKRQADADRQRAQASANRAVREKPPWED